LDLFRSTVGIWITFITGLTNASLILLVLLSCRWIPLNRFTRGWMKSNRFQRFFRLHNLYWWLFWTSIVVHMTFAIGRLGVPF
jgi:hypothetical protein